jgi:hypothetical protein
MPVVISQHLLNVFVQLANKRGLKKIIYYYRAVFAQSMNCEASS